MQNDCATYIAEFMGVRGLLTLISANKGVVCTECCIKGELIIDGYAILQELYDLHDLDWANGGCYAQQCLITLEFYQHLKSIGVKPIVVVDGGGSVQLVKEIILRRKRIIADFPEMIERKHLGRKGTSILPLMAREILVSSLRKNGIDVYVADGKAMKTVVYLANHYKCPVLVNNTNYCICNVKGGVIFFRHLDIETGKVFVYEQKRFVEFFGLRNPDLMCAVWAILGDGRTVPSLYHG